MVIGRKLKLHYEKHASQIKGHPDREEKLKLRDKQKKDAKKHFDDGLKGIKARKWDPKTKSIGIPLEDGSTKTLEFSDKAEFEAHKQADIDAVTNKLGHIKKDQKDLDEISKRVFK